MTLHSIWLRALLLGFLLLPWAGCRGGCGCGELRRSPGYRPIHPGSQLTDTTAPLPPLTMDVAETRTQGTGPNVGKTVIACPRGPTGTTCQNRGLIPVPTDVAKICAYKQPLRQLPVDDLCTKIAECGARFDCQKVLGFELRLMSEPALSALERCLRDIPCSDVVEEKEGEGLYDLCLEHVYTSLPPSEIDTCAAIRERLETCPSTTEWQQQLDTLCPAFRLVRPEILNAYRECSQGTCRNLPGCMADSGCYRVRFE